jgi:hypothetical protein
MNKRSGWAILLSIIGMIFLIGVVTAYYVPHKPFDAKFLISVLQILRDILLPFALICLAGGVGYKILAEFHPNRLANGILQAAFGVGILVFLYLIVGFLGLYQSWIAWILLFVLIVVFNKSIRGWLEQISDIIEAFRNLSPFFKCLAVMSFCIISLRLLEALAPPTHFDALVYHLWLPSKFLEAGKFIFTPENPYWGMPLSAELLYTWAMALGSPETAAVLGWFIGVLTLLGVVGLGSNISSRAGWIAAVALLAGETLSSSLSWAYVDWGMALEACGVIIALDAWRQRKTGFIVAVAGLLAGFAFGFKLTAAVVILAGWAMIVIFGGRKRFRNGTVVFSLAAGSIVMIWLGKNAFFTQSFFYPFFGGSEWIDAVKSQFYRATVAPWPILRNLLMPLSATIMGVEGASGFSASIGPLLLGLSSGVFLLKNKMNTFVKGIIVFTLVGWIIWIASAIYNPFLGQTRLFFSIFPAWGLMAAAGYEAFAKIKISQIRFERLAGVFIVISILFSGLTNLQDILQKRPMNVILGLEEEGEYLTRSLGAYYPAMEAVSNLPSDSSVLNLWEPRGFYCRPICLADTWIDRWYLDRQRFSDVEKILESWREQGFTHILLHRAGMEFIQQNDPRYQDEDWEALEDLLHKLVLVKSFGNGFEIYRLE